MAPRRRYPVPDLDAWATSRQHGVPNVEPSAWNSQEDFVSRTIRFEQNPADDSAWIFRSTLGGGAFGRVGLWEKINPGGTVVDQLAVKEMELVWDHVFPLPPPSRVWMEEEAIIQTALQRKNCYPVLQMRGWSSLMPPGGIQRKTRFYLEYCKHGDLDSIVKRYETLVRTSPDSGQHVPEPFLWQLLHSFAQTMVAMEQAPFDHPTPHDSRAYILHRDVKMLNVMLSETEDEEIIKGYPACKVGDWGMARLTDNFADARNSATLAFGGTRGWYPPEQWCGNRFGHFWVNPPPWATTRGDIDTRSNTRRPHQDPYTPAHSTYAFASIIFKLMILDAHSDALEKHLFNADQDEVGTRSLNFRWISSTDMDRDIHGQNTNYSALLKDTIADCMHLNPAFRPAATNLERLARDQLTLLAAQQYQNGVNTFPELLLS